jgi:glycosyltransferase involved in cell wall biosynthesis
MDMCNVDHVLLEQEAKSLRQSGRSAGTELLRIAASLRSQEASLPRHVDAFWATSPEDETALTKLTDCRIPGYVIPNGVDVAMRPFDNREVKASSSTLLFCGSLDYLPNREGLQWFHDSIWPRVRASRPDARLRVVGRGAARDDFESVRSDPSVEFIGEVEDVVPYYTQAGVCVVPLRLGSGTRLKIPEAMSLGNPVVSTTLGAMGLELTHGVNVAIADDANQFAAEVIRLMNDSIWFEAIRTAARRLVDEHYDWSVIGRRMDASIETLLARVS